MRITRALTGVLVAASIATLSHAQVVTQVKYLPSEYVFGTAIDGTGSVVYSVSSTNQLGTNPSYLSQIFSFDPVAGTGAQVTSFAAGVKTVSVSDDGQWLAFISDGNLTGANHDESNELFVMHPDGSGLSQVTNDTSLAGVGVLLATISGSGNRVVLLADTDPLGTNPLRKRMLYVVNRDGTGVVQLGEPVLTSAEHPVGISDDGERIVFNESAGMFTIQADGSNRQQRTAGPVGSVFISGNGDKLVYDGLNTITVVNWDGTGTVTMAPNGSAAGVTDDGLTVFYRGASSIRRINSDGTGDALVIADSGTLHFFPQGVSGDGSRLATMAPGGPVPGGSNPDGTGELVSMDETGGELQQLSSLALQAGASSLTLLSNATRMFFSSDGNYTGANPQLVPQVFTILPNGTGLAQVTNLATYGVNDFSVSDVGVTVFESVEDIAGLNPCHQYQLFRIAPGGSPTRVTNGCPSNALARFPQSKFDGQWIVFQGTYQVGSNLDGSAELFAIKSDGTGLAPITADDSSTIKEFRLNASAILPTTWIVYMSDENKDGQNPGGQYQISRIPLTGGRQRITTDPNYGSYAPDISGDANKIVFQSEADLVGENAGHLSQVFLYDVSTATFDQLTHDSCGAFDPRITRNGAWVYYTTCNALARMSLSTGVVERVQGFGNGYVQDFSPDGTGTKTALTAESILGLSANANAIFLVDQSVKPKFNIGKASPTVLSWDPDPQSKRFDVLRGNVANLSRDATNVLLGAVACLEDDSPDNDTAGNEDLVDPLPGQAFFYLYRGTVGEPPVTGSYGLGTGNRERVATTGGCNP